MDGSRFDRLVRTLTTAQTRRRALLGVAGSSLAGLLGLTRVEEASAACVKPGKKGCKGPKNKKCCVGSVCRGGTKKKAGRCACKSGTTTCATPCLDLKTDKNNCGSCGNACVGTNTCQDGVCTGTLGCPVGPDFCADDQLTGCPDQSGCSCAMDVHGAAHCTSAPGVLCADCTTNADCGAGWICVRDGAYCPCGGSACMPATCNTQCISGQNFCNSGSAADLCAGNEACGCLTSVEGFVVCSDLTEGVCTDCTTSADCEPGQVCVHASGQCCSHAPVGFQNACISTTCGGGGTSRANSASSRGAFRSPLGR